MYLYAQCKHSQVTPMINQVTPMINQVTPMINQVTPMINLVLTYYLPDVYR
jgi:ribosomal protein L30/L7E